MRSPSTVRWVLHSLPLCLALSACSPTVEERLEALDGIYQYKTEENQTLGDGFPSAVRADGDSVCFLFPFSYFKTRVKEANDDLTWQIMLHRVLWDYRLSERSYGFEMDTSAHGKTFRQTWVQISEKYARDAYLTRLSFDVKHKSGSCSPPFALTLLCRRTYDGKNRMCEADQFMGFPVTLTTSPGTGEWSASYVSRKSAIVSMTLDLALENVDWNAGSSSTGTAAINILGNTDDLPGSGTCSGTIPVTFEVVKRLHNPGLCKTLPEGAGDY